MTIPKPRITFERLFYWILIITVAIMWFKSCTKKPPSAQVAIETEKRKAIDSSQKALVKVTDSLTKEIVKREDRADSILGESTVFEYERNQAWGVIKDRDNMIKSLASKIVDDHGTNDTDCVELAKQSQIQSQRLNEQEGITVKLLGDLHLLSKTKDSTIADERRIKNAALKHGLEVAKAYSDLFATFKKEQPRNALLIGPEASWSPWTQTVGGIIALQNKKGTQYQFGAGLDAHNAGYYFKVGLMYKISLHKNK